MATPLARQAPPDPDVPLYRMDVDRYHRLVDAGALDGVEVEWLEGLLIDKYSHREEDIHRLDVGTFERMVASDVVFSPAEGVSDLDVAQLFADAAL